MNMVQTTNFGAPEPPHPFDAPRPPDDLPISAAAWDAAKAAGGHERWLGKILYEAITKLEGELIALKAK